MYKLFDKDETYILPSGRTLSGLELCSEKEYGNLAYGKWLINTNDNNIVLSFISYENAMETYGIDLADTTEAVNALNTTIRLLNKRKINSKLLEPSIQKAAKFAALSFTDEQALEVPDLYPAYEVDHAYKKDERFNYNGRLFKVNQDHTSAAQWVPYETGTESLYTCLEMAGDGYLVWTQPTGAHNAYNTGDIVHYPTADDPLYKSLINGNTWSPDAYPQGWEIYTEE